MGCLIILFCCPTAFGSRRQSVNLPAKLLRPNKQVFPRYSFYRSSRRDKKLILGKKTALGLCLPWSHSRLQKNTALLLSRQERNLYFRLSCFKNSLFKRLFLHCGPGAVVEELLLILRNFLGDHGLHPFSVLMTELTAKAFQLISDSLTSHLGLF